MLDVRTSSGIAVLIILLVFSQPVSGTQNATLPLFFDLRNVDSHSFIPPVKTQGGVFADGEADVSDTIGICWAFGAFASFESNLLKQAIVTDPQAPDLNLSEWHMGYWNNKTLRILRFNNHTMPGSSPPLPSGYGEFSPVVKTWGGDIRIAIDYLSSGKGPVSAAEAPFPLADVQAHRNLTPPPEHIPTRFFLHDALILYSFDFKTDDEYRNAIKQWLMQYGALQTAIHIELGEYPHEDAPGYFNKTMNTMYCDNASLAGQLGHSVAIIGWDDLKIVPEAQESGAWIVRDSLGSEFRDNGYFWVSYADKVFVKEPSLVIAYIAGTGSAYNRTFRYQTYEGALSQTTFTEGNNAYDYLSDGDSFNGSISWGAGRFRAIDSAQLNAIGLVTTNRNERLTIRIYDTWDLPHGRPAGLRYERSVTIPERGYHVIDLMHPIPVQKDRDFVIAVGFLPNPDAIAEPLIYVSNVSSSGNTLGTYQLIQNQSYGNSTGWIDYSNIHNSSIFYIQGFTSSENSASPSLFPFITSPTGKLPAGFVFFR